MDRRDFIKNSMLAAAAVGIGVNGYAQSTEKNEKKALVENEKGNKSLLASEPVLENYAETSMGVAFAVSDMANGFVIYGLKPDLSDGETIKCGGYRVTDMNDKVMLVRLTNLMPATTYYYRIGAERIHYGGGYDMKKLETEISPTIYSFTTAGKNAEAHFCVINDTHAHDATLDALIKKIKTLAPSCLVWNGDASNTQETIESQIDIFITPKIDTKAYAARMPMLFCPGNHDNRGFANRHLERVWMYRQPEERLSKYWDLGRNFAVRMGDIAMIGLDTAEDKLDDDTRFAGLFASKAYREAQSLWLADALKQPEIASAPFLVGICHIPLYDSNPKANPGDVPVSAPEASKYTEDFAVWQRTCANLWGPQLTKAKCQLMITAHQHSFRYDEATVDRSWAQIVGGGNSLNVKKKENAATVIDVCVKSGKLCVDVYNMMTNEIEGTYSFEPRKMK